MWGHKFHRGFESHSLRHISIAKQEIQQVSAPPQWLKKRIHITEQIEPMQGLLADLGLHTVCESARCPNIAECFGQGRATFMILGDVCTRNCKFCAVKSGTPSPPESDEPARVAQAVQRLRLRYAVITSVTRDDLPDGGASHFAQTIQQIRETAPKAAVEVLVPDFRGSWEAIQKVVDAEPEVLGHNVETVPSLYETVRPGARYNRSLRLLELVKSLDSRIYLKSGLMLGLGECKKEVTSVLEDLRKVGCDIITLGQYLRPTKAHVQVKRFIPPEEFQDYEALAKQMGFLAVAAGPFVRSSYQAEELWEKARSCRWADHLDSKRGGEA